MPKLRSVMAGLAISTALTGGVVAAGAATTAANAGTATKIGAGTTVLTGVTGCHRGRRCGGGWGRRNRLPKIRIFIHNINRNVNLNDRHERRFDQRFDRRFDRRDHHRFGDRDRDWFDD
ncbi:hypothetical protein FH608_032485 [Nonomuraea phyllanthi]|uniref:Uncharacterized protein n=1 Tax=Nonomuraea phyllanthi TaxID=2219224 RepID=A0A5C4VC49_9ACTN|nr:hypothetical protein [Nonomuraea phyllanthi]KAB8191300.1 hypothetical protein FH608_032485 [Nonomuraea phyllanthi]QFY12641.1 hypothetical protein GBF35_44130 [Nonomuraea phyllanthi]